MPSDVSPGLESPVLQLAEADPAYFLALALSRLPALSIQRGPHGSTYLGVLQLVDLADALLPCLQPGHRVGNAICERLQRGQRPHGDRDPPHPPLLIESQVIHALQRASLDPQTKGDRVAAIAAQLVGDKRIFKDGGESSEQLKDAFTTANRLSKGRGAEDHVLAQR